ncbi:MAG: hypothetical protein ABWZ86_05515 [Hyphomicrobium sp.]
MRMRALLIATAALMMPALSAHAGTVDPAQAIAQKFSEASDENPAPTAAQRSFDKPGMDYEEDMLQRARVEEQEREQHDARQVVSKPVIEAVASKAPAPVAPPVAAVSPPPVLAALPPKPAAEPTVVVHGPPSNPTPGSATVLLVLDPEVLGRGIKPDPIICIDNSCWLSNGIGTPALAMPRNQAVVLPTTAASSPNSCSGKSGCVYRNVIVDPTQRIDVIEVGEGGGASAGAYTVTADRSCRKSGATLSCDDGLATQNFRIWVVPEAIADAAGPTSLENAVAEGLPDSDVTSANDK